MPRKPKPRGPGRPPKPAGERRAKYVPVRLTEAELALLKAAQAAGETLGACLRRLALGAVDKLVCCGAECDETREAWVCQICNRRYDKRRLKPHRPLR